MIEVARLRKEGIDALDIVSANQRIDFYLHGVEDGIILGYDVNIPYRFRRQAMWAVEKDEHLLLQTSLSPLRLTPEKIRWVDSPDRRHDVNYITDIVLRVEDVIRRRTLNILEKAEYPLFRHIDQNLPATDVIDWVHAAYKWVRGRKPEDPSVQMVWYDRTPPRDLRLSK